MHNQNKKKRSPRERLNLKIRAAEESSQISISISETESVLSSTNSSLQHTVTENLKQDFTIVEDQVNSLNLLFSIDIFIFFSSLEFQIKSTSPSKFREKILEDEIMNLEQQLKEKDNALKASQESLKRELKEEKNRHIEQEAILKKQLQRLDEEKIEMKTVINKTIANEDVVNSLKASLKKNELKISDFSEQVVELSFKST